MYLGDDGYLEQQQASPIVYAQFCVSVTALNF